MFAKMKMIDAIFTEDGQPTTKNAQWEYTILITEDGNEILTH